MNVEAKLNTIFIGEKVNKFIGSQTKGISKI